VASLPGAFGGRAAHVVANALAAVAACRAAGISMKDIRRGLAGFTPGEANPGRGNVYRAGEVPVIVDYGHNAAALHATGSMIAQVWGLGSTGWRPGTTAAGRSAGRDSSENAAAVSESPGELAGSAEGASGNFDGDRADWRGAAVAAVTLPGDRRDDLLAQTAEAIASWFAAVVIYEDSDKRGRAPGEMQALISGVLRRVRPGMTCELASGPEEALRRAVALAGGAPVLFLYEKLDAARAALDAIGATPWPDAAPWAGRPARSAAPAADRPPADLAAQVDEVLAAAEGMAAGAAVATGRLLPADASADYASGGRGDDDDEPDSAPKPVPA
jgi:cyanophycin synthetase